MKSAVWSVVIVPTLGSSTSASITVVTANRLFHTAAESHRGMETAQFTILVRLRDANQCGSTLRFCALPKQNT